MNNTFKGDAHNVIITNGNNNQSAIHDYGATPLSGETSELTELANAIASIKTADRKTLLELKSGLDKLKSAMPFESGMELSPLMTALDYALADTPETGETGETGKKAWKTILSNYIGTPDKLAKTAGLLGKFGKTFLSVLRRIFLHA